MEGSVLSFLRAEWKVSDTGSASSLSCNTFSLYILITFSRLLCLINRHGPIENRGPSWPWSYASWIYNYLCNQCLSPLMLWVRISIKARCTTLCYKVCQWLATDWWFSPGPPVSSTNKTDRHDITEILLKVALNTIKQANIKLAYFYKYTFEWK